MVTGKLLHRTLEGLGEAVVRVIGLMPWRVVLWIGGCSGRIAGLVMRRKDLRVRWNLRLAGVADPNRVCRRVWGHLGRNLFEMIWNIGNSADRAMKHVIVEGADALSDASERGRGVILVSGHMGNWELVSLAASRAGAPLAVVAKPLRLRRLERRVIDFRRKNSIRTLVRGATGSSVAAYRWLRDGRMLGCMMDRSGNGRRTLIPFLGGGMNIPLGPAVLASRLDASIVLGSAVREKNGVTKVSFRRLRTDGARNAQAIAWSVGEALQEEVSSHPEQWLWIFRQQPCWDGESMPRFDEGMLPVKPRQAVTK